MSEATDESPVIYAVRLSERAKRNADAITVFLADAASEWIAVQWRVGLNKAVGNLPIFPHGKPIVEKSNLFSYIVRDYLYRRSPDSKAYRVLYRTVEESPDGSQAILMGVRLAERATITAAEAREIEAQQ